MGIMGNKMETTKLYRCSIGVIEGLGSMSWGLVSRLNHQKTSRPNTGS